MRNKLMREALVSLKCTLVPSRNQFTSSRFHLLLLSLLQQSVPHKLQPASHLCDQRYWKWPHPFHRPLASWPWVLWQWGARYSALMHVQLVCVREPTSTEPPLINEGQKPKEKCFSLLLFRVDSSDMNFIRLPGEAWCHQWLVVPSTGQLVNTYRDWLFTLSTPAP